MRDPIDTAFRIILITTAIFIATVILNAAAATAAAVHPVTAFAIATICAFVTIDAWRGR